MSATLRVDKPARLIGVLRGGKRHGGLVICRAASHVEDEPAIGQLQDNRIAFLHHLRSEYRLVIVPGPVLVGYHEEVGNHESGLRFWEVVSAHLKPPLIRVEVMGRVYIAVRLETTGVAAENLLRLSQRVFADAAAKTGLARRTDDRTPAVQTDTE